MVLAPDAFWFSFQTTVRVAANIIVNPPFYGICIEKKSRTVKICILPSFKWFKI